ncbi:hypothetical protein ElyMa_005211500 [Elysia marginata]|uniref:Secreted protein n=1 Tax=Elysia marginata TaxID=1093978 RepID=A0AAV4JUJ9_9GAST|nr:hypothetical protein ElyMa_005211500 [Elysia marginata]
MVLAVVIATTLAVPMPRDEVEIRPIFVGGCAGTRYGCCPDGVTSQPPPGSNAVCPPGTGGGAGPGYSILTGH